MSSVITALVAKVKMDTSEVTAGSAQVRKDAAVVSRVFRDMETDTDKLEKKVRALHGQFERGAIDSNQYAAALKHLHAKYVEGPALIKQEAEAAKLKAHADKMVKQKLDRLSAARQAAMPLIKKSITESERYKESIHKLVTALKAGAISQEEYNKAVKQMVADRSQQKAAKEAADASKKKAEADKIAADASRKAKEQEQQVNAARQAVLPMINKTRTATEQYAIAFRQLAQAHRMGAISEEEHRRAMAMLRSEMAKTQAAGKLHNRMASSIGNAFSFLSPQVLAASAAMGVFYGAVRFLQNSIKLAASLEEINVRFEVMTGNAKDAEELVASMRTLANTTALTFSGLQKNAQTMLAFGVATENVIPVLKQIGDITAGDAERMQSLTLAFSQMSSAGKLMGQDLLQMINAGFNPLQEISEKTGVSIAELRKQMEAGAISADLVNAAFESATSAGGRFQGMLEESKNTFSGQMRQLNSDLEVITTAIGEELLPTVKELVSVFSSLSSSENISFIRELTYLLTATNKLAFDPLNTAMDALERYGVIDPAKQMEGFASGAAKATTKIVDSEQKMKQLLDAAKSDAFREMTEEFEKQIEMLELGEKAFERKQMYAKGFTAEQIKQIEAQKEYIAQQEAIIEKEKQAEKERKRQAEERKKIMDDAMKRGAELMQQHSPVKQVEDQLADLQVLLVANAIDQATFFKERNKILKQSLSRDAMPEASAIEVGSAEFVKMVAGQMNQEVDAQIQKLEEQRLLQAAQLAATKETNRRLQEMGIMKRIMP